MSAPSGKRLLIALLALVALIGLALLTFRYRRSTTAITESAGDSISQELVDQFVALESQEKQMDETVWAREILAQECGRAFEDLWDALNRAPDKMAVLASWPVAEIVPPKLRPPQRVVHNIELQDSEGAGAPWDAARWRRFLSDCAAAGWLLAQAEFRHVQFDTDAGGKPRQSHFYFSAHLTNSQLGERAILEGDVVVDWSTQPGQDGRPAVKRIDASHLTAKSRRGDPPFQLILEKELAPPRGSYFIDPLILYDLDGDGLSEIILAASNTVFCRRNGNRFDTQPLCRHDPGLIFTGLIADFDGDGAADFLAARFEGLVLFKGSAQGTFDEPGRPVWSVKPHLKYAQALTCGDIDRDGDLDVWLGQYKLPMERGQIPTPFYDANDGHPSYLLLNDGQGHFTDVTEAAGLGAKRWRRSYSGSLVDLDHDGDLDLMVVSDFAGIDLYANDGHGHFTDVTRQWAREPHAFGMAHALADFDDDGRLDVLMIGMNSPTADRLDHLGLVRPRHDAERLMRSRMAFGNRLYLAGPDGGFELTSFGESIARSGWSWGCSAFDFDNDGFPDVYIANGHETKGSVREYEPEFWLHDIYVGGSKEDIVVDAYLRSKSARTRGRGHSFGGYEKNRLFLNRQGASFLEVGHLMGVALEQDSRNVVADDLDGDGRVDLLVTTFEAWPKAKQTLRAYQNTLEPRGHWIGFRFREGGGGTSPVGVQLAMRRGGRSTVRQVVTGDSYRSQHSNTVHFGLGEADRVDSVDIRWSDGRHLTLREPAVNRYHAIRAPTNAPP